MVKLNNIKSYLKTPTKCYIPICKAKCCTNAPLPEDFLPKFEGRIQRQIYSAVNIGQNDPRDTFNSIIYNTTQNPIQVVGRDQHGNSVFSIPKKVIEELNIKSMEQIQDLLKKYDGFENYCPFITDFGKCSVYAHRPHICREFGTAPGKINWCPEKSSRLDVLKFHARAFVDFYVDLFKSVFKKFGNKSV